jgi:hypothetical protein
MNWELVVNAFAEVAIVKKAEAVFWASAASLGNWPMPVPLAAYAPQPEPVS